MSRPNMKRNTSAPVLNVDPEDLAKAVEEIRLRGIFDDGEVKLTPIAEQHYIAALADLERARTAFTLAHYFRMRGE